MKDDDREFNHPAYLNIPLFILQDQKLDFFNKFLFGLFWSFSVSGKKHHKVSNPYLAALFGVNESYIGKRLKELEELKYIKRTIVKYKRVIEVTFLVYDHVDTGENGANIALVPPVGVPSTNIELPPPTGVPPSSCGSTLPPPTGVPDNILDNISIKKQTPISPKGVKFGLEDILKDNPFNIPESVLTDWMVVRKNKRAAMTATAWKRTNDNLAKLHKAGLCPIDCFEKAVGNSWAGVEFRYFTQDIEATKKTPVIRSVDDAKLREELKQQAIAREKKEEEAKEREKSQAPKFMKQLKVTQAERMAKQEADRLKLGMSVTEYHDYITKKPNS
jgi:hypothetical protein